MKKTLYLCLLTLLVFSCKKEDNLIVKEEANDLSKLATAEAYLLPSFFETSSYARQIPAYLRMAGLRQQPARNEVAALGRVLFYDKSLSRDRSVACASCHKQDRAFADDVAFSGGIEGQRSLRNSMALANVASLSAHYSPLKGVTPPFLWDHRASSVADLSRMAFTNEHEMGMTMPQVVEQVKNQVYYPYLWSQAYGDTEITEAKVLEAISEFVGTIGSSNAQLDQAMASAQQDFDMPNNLKLDTAIVIQHLYYGTVIDTSITLVAVGLKGLSSSQNKGREIFIANCTKCHSPIRPFQEVFAACNGLDMNYKDAGMASSTGRAEDAGVFKSPSLRNIALTAPYMHDGRFQTLEEVVEHYATGVKRSATLDPNLAKHPDGGVPLSTADKSALVAFLKTLTDMKFVRPATAASK